MASRFSSWPPPTSVWETPSPPIRTPLHTYPPPDGKLVPLPPLPTPQRSPNVHPSFVLSTHLVPAAYLRATRQVESPPPSMMPSGDSSLTRRERMHKLIQVREWLLNVRGADAEGKRGYERVLWASVNRYRRLDLGELARKRKTRGFTLFFAHGTGFPKEIWEPILKHLLASHAHLIDEIWTWEAVNHGDSALVNEKELTPLYDWMDNARDILNFFTYYIPSSASSKSLPVHLPRLSTLESNKRASHGIPTRNIVCIGHSFGGCSITLTALFSPQLFTGLVLVDPVIMLPGALGYPVYDVALNALSRRETWKSRSEALALFKGSPFFASWDREALELYVECGLYASRDAQGNDIMKLKMSSLHEASVFLETHTSYETYALLPSLNSKVRLRWIVPFENPLEYVCVFLCKEGLLV
ncbi:hypothetical protein AX15_002221 [Amanita polypyramis BW_CC]|nr:hypothetical protein AX15_002221 [Amanita polypyramis BW_CC]